MSGIPSGWANALFEEINYFPSSTLNPAQFSDEIFELFSVPSFPSRQPEIIRGQEIGSTKQIVEPNDVLVCKINPRINRVWQVTPKRKYRQIASSEWIVMRVPEMDARYLTYYFLSKEFRKLICTGVSGIGGSLTRAQPKHVAFFPVKIAPLEEQNKIADKLDSLLARVDECCDRLDRLSNIIKQFRQSVLANAASGKLTEDWRAENSHIESKTDLFVKLQERFGADSINRELDSQGKDSTEFLLPEDWLHVPIEAVGDVFLGRQRSPKNHNGPHMHPYVRAANITWDGWDLSNVKEMNFDSSDFKRFELHIGDILVNEGSGSANEVGKPAIWNGEIENCCFQNTLICVRPYEDMSEYLYFVLLHAALSKAFVKETRGIGIHHLGKTRFSAFRIPIPPFEEQKEIVRRVKTLFAYADRLEGYHQKTLGKVESIINVLLDAAFRGELVDQNPHEESAMSLLEKIQVERAAKTKTVSIKRKPKRV